MRQFVISVNDDEHITVLKGFIFVIFSFNFKLFAQNNIFTVT